MKTMSKPLKFKGKNLSKKSSSILITSLMLFLGACNQVNNDNAGINNNANQGIPIKFLAGSDLKDFCEQTAQKLNQTQPKLSNGQAYYLTCDIKGSGDVVNEVINLAQQLSSGTIQANSDSFPTLISVDGEIYHSQLIYQIDKIFPGQNYIPQITDSALIAYSPMVFMTTAELAPTLQKVSNIYTALAQYKTYNEIDPKAPPLPIYFAQTAPTRSNSGLQTLVAQFASVANKQPQDLTIADVQKHQEEIRRIQEKVTRYGKSTGTLARSMVENGSFWASVGSVYESLVITANSQTQPNQVKYEAVYPKATFSSNMRAILPNTPWVSAEEKEAAEKIIAFMLTPETQQIAVDLGLRPGTPGINLGEKFSAQFGVNPSPTYESYRSPKPEVVEAMLKSWQEYAKKPSQVVVVVDTSGSMRGQKMTSVQNTLLNYVNNLGPREEIALISFNSEIAEPVVIKGTPEGKNQGITYISSLQANGGTRLYDSALTARNWLQKNLKPNAINAVLILTDGEDSGSNVSLAQLESEMQKSGFNSDERIAFFTVGYGNDGEFNAQVLEEIAKINGGYYRKGDPTTIATVMQDLQVEF
jgi:Ca-activated chloride channel family protein